MEYKNYGSDEKESEIILDDNNCRIMQPIKTIDKSSFLEEWKFVKRYGDFIFSGSHVQDLYNSIYLNLPKEKFVVANISGSCAIYFNNESCDYNKVLNFIKDNKDNIKFFFYT